MEKKILILLNSEPKEYITVKKTTKIEDVKKYLEKYPNVEIQMYIDSKNQLNVFDTDKYNKNKLETVWKNMKNSQIFLTSKSNPIGIKDIDVNNIIQIFGNLDAPTILNTCRVDKKFSEICDRKSFEIWSMLLKRDYGIISNNYSRVKENPKAFYLKIFKNINENDRRIINDSKFKETIETIKKYNPVGSEFISGYKFDYHLPNILLVPSQKAIESFSKKSNLTIDEFLHFIGLEWIINNHILSYRRGEDSNKPFADIKEMSYGKSNFSGKPKIINIDKKENNISVSIDGLIANVIREIPTNTGIKVFEIDKILDENIRKFKKIYINSIPIFIRIEGEFEDYSVDVFTTADRFNSIINGRVNRRFRDKTVTYDIQTSSWGSLNPEYIRNLAILYETIANILDDIKNNKGEIPIKYKY